MKAPTRTRLEIDVKLYYQGKLVTYTKRWKKSAARAFCERVSDSEWDLGRVRVWYDRSKDYWNEAEFTGLSQFNELLSIFTEWDLVKGFIVV